ncbi:MAG: tetratricopeptide repeat protein [Sterolibacterium sp.]|nr:tetratricopeptide repeat protein [Sterolibacterium sp.]
MRDIKQTEAGPTSHEIEVLVALFSEGRYAEAEILAREITARFPMHGFGWKALGVVLKQMGRAIDALAPMRRAVELMPDDVETHNNLGVALRNLAQLDGAVASYRRALEIKPEYADAHNNLGYALQYMGYLHDAAASYRRALWIKPDSAEAHNNLGNILREMGQLDEAEASYRRALGLKPDLAEVQNNLGATLQDMGRLSEAEVNLRRALEIKPDYAEAHNNLGITLQYLDRLGEAEVSYRQALEIKPDFSQAHSNLLFSYNFLPKQAPAEMLAQARAYGKLAAQQAHPFISWHNDPDPSRQLRVGLVSGDLISHPVGYFIEGILKSFASQFASRLEFYAYTCFSRTDALTERLRACCRAWCSAVWQSDEILARQIRDDGIDILIDLSGHTAHNRLPMFAWKPAPVQVSWLGYFATTGVAAIDYLIADPWVLPETEEVYFTEKIWRLPETRLCFTPPDMDLDVSPLPALTNGYVTFGCFNNLTKMNDDVVAVWSRVLATVPNSRLFLKARQLNDASARQRTIDRFSAHGIDAKRLILEETEPREKYLAAYRRIDIALDPFPFSGGTTSVDSLWMGVPVLTLAGERFLSRQGVGILMNAGLPEWVAVDTGDYVARSALHAINLPRLAKLRNGLRKQVLASPITDAKRFSMHFEDSLRAMWRKWCDK